MCIRDRLYFAGEMVDIDGICGGYNLQWAWSSGAVAVSYTHLDVYKRQRTYCGQYCYQI